MLALLLLLTIGFVVWKLCAPAMAWAPALAALLDRPVRTTGFLPFVAGLETGGGEFTGRPVRLAIHHKRGRHSVGHLVVAMQPRTTPLQGPDALDLLRTTEAGAAFEALVTDGLMVSIQNGWLKATWQPVGFMMFPGEFDAQRWRRVLQAMSVVAASLEAHEKPAAHAG